MEVIEKACNDYFTPSATYDTIEILDPPRCHPGTRVAILDRLSEWVKSTDNRCNIFWLSGPAGAGKSAIARSLAERLARENDKHLAGTFFFFKTDPRKNSEKPLIPHLAYEISCSIPEIQPYMARAIMDEPMICSRSIQTQIEKLIVNPITKMSSESGLSQPQSRNRPMLILIDGLDECEDRQARRLVLTSIFKFLPRLRGHLKFLIVTRPEHDIASSFRLIKDSLDTFEMSADSMANRDIYKYLHDNFERLKRDHPIRKNFGPDWPPSASIDALVKKSSGNFIYACTVIKYIETVYDHPEKRLEDIILLRKTSENPYAELDALYHSILSSSKYDHKMLANILSVALVSTQIYNPFPYNGITGPNNLTNTDYFVECVLDLEPGVAKLALLDLKSLITLKKARWSEEGYLSNTRIIKFSHKSFSDFLFDPSRSKEFHVDFKSACTLVARGCIRLVSNDSYVEEK